MTGSARGKGVVRELPEMVKNYGAVPNKRRSMKWDVNDDFKIIKGFVQSKANGVLMYLEKS